MEYPIAYSGKVMKKCLDDDTIYITLRNRLINAKNKNIHESDKHILDSGSSMRREEMELSNKN